MEKKIEYDRVFRALGDRHRLQILDMLMEREMNAGEILEAMDVVQSTLSHHMKSLCESGLVNARKSGKWTYYTVSSDVAEEARRFLERYLIREEQNLPVREEKADPEKPKDQTVRTAVPEETTAPEQKGPEPAPETTSAESGGAEKPKKDKAKKEKGKKEKDKKAGKAKKGGKKNKRKKED